MAETYLTGPYELTKRYIGLSSDLKPKNIPPGAEFYETDTFKTYITRDGLNWIEKLQQVILLGSTGSNLHQILTVDPSTRLLVQIDAEHHEVHEGDHFFCTDSVTLASAATQVYLLTAPDTVKLIHLTFLASGSAITQVDLYEGADRTGTTAQTCRNNDRNSAVAAGLVVHKGISAGSTDGTLIWTIKSGSSTNQSRSPLVADRKAEIILKRNTKYLLRTTSGTDNNLTNLQLEWYEHTSLTA